MKKNKNDGVERQVQHKEPIRQEDLALLDEYFSDVLKCGDAVKLTEYCWLQISLHFVLRGSEVQIQLKKTDVEFHFDPSGKEYVVLSTDFMSKNCSGGLKGCPFELCGRLQKEQQVAAMHLLLEKLHPKVERLFQ